MDGCGWIPVLPGSLETGTKGPEEQRQVGSVGVRASGSADTAAGNLVPPAPAAPAKGRGIGQFFMLVCSPCGFSPKALKDVLSPHCSSPGECIHLKDTGFWGKKNSFLELSGHRKSLLIIRG